MLNFTPALPASLPPPLLKQRRRMGLRDCSQSITAPLCCSLLLTLFPGGKHGSSLWAAVLQNKPSPLWSSPCATGEAALVSGAPSSPPSSLTLVFMGLFLTFFFFFLCSSLCDVFCPFLNIFSPEVPPALLMGSAVPCGESVEDIWNQLCPAWGSHPATKGLLPTPSTRRKSGHFPSSCWTQASHFAHLQKLEESLCNSRWDSRRHCPRLLEMLCQVPSKSDMSLQCWPLPQCRFVRKFGQSLVEAVEKLIQQV